MREFRDSFIELSQLISDSVEGIITSKDVARLNEILSESEDARQYYFELMDILVLTEHLCSEEVFFLDDKESDHLGLNSYEGLLDSLAQEEKNAPAIQLPKEYPQIEVIDKVVYQPREKRKISKFQIAAFIMSAAAVLFFVLFIKLIPEPTSVQVATVMDQINTTWSRPDDAPENGDRLWTLQAPLDLKKGIVKLRYDEGVDVLIEGPAAFEIGESEIYLEYGRLYSNVSNNGIGFEVETPTTKFVDLGTEFGAQADVDGSAELHVIKGKVQLFAGLSDGSKTSQLVTENKAMRYDANKEAVKEIAVEKEAFVRVIDSLAGSIWRGQTHLSLADIASGGDGFGTALPNMGIDFKTGKLVSGSSECRGDGSGYIPVPELAFVDGVFVPTKNEVAVQLTSEGHSYSEFGPVDGQYYMAVGSYKMVDFDFVENMPFQLKGCPADESVNLCLHASAGITFDLEKIRRSMSFLDIKRFTSLCGVSENPNKTILSSFYVFVDGQPRLIERRVSDDNEPIEISIPLGPDDRFLTLACMEEDRNYSDWTLFVNPRLEAEER